jgi:hypothetical protein
MPLSMTNMGAFRKFAISCSENCATKWIKYPEIHCSSWIRLGIHMCFYRWSKSFLFYFISELPGDGLCKIIFYEIVSSFEHFWNNKVDIHYLLDTKNI